MWAQPGGVFLSRKPPQLCTPRRPGGFTPHSRVLAVAVPKAGRVVWSAGTTSINIWDAYTGEGLQGLQGSGFVGGGCVGVRVLADGGEGDGRWGFDNHPHLMGGRAWRLRVAACRLTTSPPPPCCPPPAGACVGAFKVTGDSGPPPGPDPDTGLVWVDHAVGLDPSLLRARTRPVPVDRDLDSEWGLAGG